MGGTAWNVSEFGADKLHWWVRWLPLLWIILYSDLGFDISWNGWLCFLSNQTIVRGLEFEESWVWLNLIAFPTIVIISTANTFGLSGSTLILTIPQSRSEIGGDLKRIYTLQNWLPLLHSPQMATQISVATGGGCLRRMLRLQPRVGLALSILPQKSTTLTRRRTSPYIIRASSEEGEPSEVDSGLVPGVNQPDLGPW